MFTTTYRIGGSTIRCEFVSAAPPEVEAVYELYRVADGEADVRCRHRVVAAGELPATEDGASVRVLRRDSSVSILDFARREVEHFMVAEAGSTLVAGPGLMEMAPFLPSLAAAAVHGLGVLRDGAAALFLAPDEGGKTTVGRLRPGGTVLSDDQVILRLEGDQLTAHSTPWGRMGVAPTSAPVGAYFLLEKADTFALTSLRSTAVVEYLWQEGLIHYHMLPRAQKVEALDLLRAISRQAPAYRMRFPREFVDWNAVDAAMAAR